MTAHISQTNINKNIKFKNKNKNYNKNYSAEKDKEMSTTCQLFPHQMKYARIKKGKKQNGLAKQSSPYPRKESARHTVKEYLITGFELFCTQTHGMRIHAKYTRCFNTSCMNNIP